jgi:Flp pilus assembly protein TadG
MMRPRRRRGAVLIWFAGAFLTMFSFTGLVAIDFGQVIYSRSEIKTVASDAALRGAREYLQDTSSEQAPLLMDEAAARAVVAEIVKSAQDLGAVRKARITSTTVTFQNNEPTNALWFEQPASQMRVPRVVVTISYEVPGLVMLDLGMALLGKRSEVVTGTIVASAVICVPGLNPDTLQGACQRTDA